MGVPPVTGSAAEQARRRELGACLRSYRALVTPAQVGLPAGGRRRTPGLRREEVASLSGVGLSWYTWLEQGRVAASAQVVDAVGRVLGLDAAARRHLRGLTGATPPVAVLPDLRPLLATWPASPAVQVDHRLDMVTANRAWCARFGAPPDHLLERLAAERLPGASALLLAVAREFRMAANRHAGDGRIAEVTAALRASVPDLDPVWQCRGVGAFGTPGLVLDGTPARAHLLRPSGTPDTAVLLLAAA